MADIDGTANGETLTGTADADLINALAGEDEVFGLDGDDRLNGDDTINGGAGTDTINGGDGDDRLAGEDGDDDFTGGDGNDRFLAGAGTDVLHDFRAGRTARLQDNLSACTRCATISAGSACSSAKLINARSSACAMISAARSSGRSFRLLSSCST